MVVECDIWVIVTSIMLPLFYHQSLFDQHTRPLPTYPPLVLVDGKFLMVFEKLFLMGYMQKKCIRVGSIVVMCIYKHNFTAFASKLCLFRVFFNNL